MQAIVIDKLDELKTYVGKEVAVTDWMPVTQERIQQFADATGDHQWIHVDPERAGRESPYGAPIAHGFLTLSLLSQFMMQATKVQGIRLAINYGLNRVRFPSAVPVGSKIRARFTLQSLKDLPDGVETVWAAVVEREKAEKPCCAAEWVVRYYR